MTSVTGALKHPTSFGGVAANRGLPLRSREGFTLAEVMLALVLLVVFAAVGTIVLRPWRLGAGFDEGVTRLESVIIQARADAARSGKRLRMEFTGDGGEIRVLMENQPLKEPGVFSEYTCLWKESIVPGLLRVSACQLTGSAGYDGAWTSKTGGVADESAGIPALVFYPNGSCDSAVLELTPVDQEDTRRAVVQIDELGVVSVRTMTPTEYQEYLQDRASAVMQ